MVAALTAMMIVIGAALFGPAQSGRAEIGWPVLGGLCVAATGLALILTGRAGGMARLAVVPAGLVFGLGGSAVMLAQLGAPVGFAHAVPEPPAAKAPAPRPSLLVMTGLPLIWGEGAIGEVLSGARAPQRSWQRLDRDFRVTAIDRIDDAALKGAVRLLLAQPRALAPEELVAIDRWVRGGGRLLVLADPSLRWESLYPVGDPRTPPPTSLLDPLMTHWGLVLDLVHLDPQPAPVDAMLTIAGRRWKLALDAPGRFRTLGKGCTTEQAGLIARCLIGEGKALFVADADLLADRLWVGAGADGDSPEKRLADNGSVIVGWLDQLSGISRDRSGDSVVWVEGLGALARAVIMGLLPALILLGPAIIGFLRLRRRES